MAGSINTLCNTLANQLLAYAREYDLSLLEEKSRLEGTRALLTIDYFYGQLTITLAYAREYDLSFFEEKSRLVGTRARRNSLEWATMVLSATGILMPATILPGVL